jgi:hypothetical protein
MGPRTTIFWEKFSARPQYLVVIYLRIRATPQLGNLRFGTQDGRIPEEKKSQPKRSWDRILAAENRAPPE